MTRNDDPRDDLPAAVIALLCIVCAGLVIIAAILGGSR